jgi:hypothetical protein
MVLLLWVVAASRAAWSAGWSTNWADPAGRQGANARLGTAGGGAVLPVAGGAAGVTVAVATLVGLLSLVVMALRRGGGRGNQIAQTTQIKGGD